jgi:hypothetical protein
MINNKIESSEVKTPRRRRQANECKTVCFITSFKQFGDFFAENSPRLAFVTTPERDLSKIYS